jgi:hypothetical protein
VPPHLRVPLLHGRVLPPPVALPPLGLARYVPRGLVACDPSTGVPLPGYGAGIQILPPCIRVPTVPLDPVSVPLAEDTAQPGAGEKAATAPSLVDVGLQTSFTETDRQRSPHLVQEVSRY